VEEIISQRPRQIALLCLMPLVLTMCASCGTVYCNRFCLFVGGCVCGSVTTITRNCLHRS